MKIEIIQPEPIAHFHDLDLGDLVRTSANASPYLKIGDKVLFDLDLNVPVEIHAFKPGVVFYKALKATLTVTFP